MNSVPIIFTSDKKNNVTVISSFYTNKKLAKTFNCVMNVYRIQIKHCEILRLVDFKYRNFGTRCYAPRSRIVEKLLLYLKLKI